ncbi:MAG: DUF3955 domain-containing protein [Flavobacteriaceae bacterium]|nr:DUF3955 domain-containing protein [Flavobacteriaceae bacterium]MBL6684193.1 DUF3955 domain-containing protein [Flavobacteriaceae bacterium]
METKFKIATSFLVIGIVCFLAFYLIDSKVDENTILQEPFFLLPVGFVSLLVSVFLFILFAVLKKK